MNIINMLNTWFPSKVSTKRPEEAGIKKLVPQFVEDTMDNLW